MTILEEVKAVLIETLQLEDRADTFTDRTALLGAIPEFDSMAVISVITALEERYDFMVMDDEIDAEVFETLGSLAAFVQHKLSQ